MEMHFRIREPVIGVNVIGKKGKCNCDGLEPGERGTIVAIDSDGLQFQTSGHYLSAWNCVQCAEEVRNITKAEWIEICDKQGDKRGRNTRTIG